MAETTTSAYSLVSLIHAVAAGQFAVPEFQRGFVWSSANVLALFDSINRGLPIGTVVAVEYSGIHFQSRPFPRSGFPEPLMTTEERSLVYWIIDGVQRISALYNGLQDTPASLHVHYDLRKRTFFMQPKSDDAPALPMSTLFDTRAMMSHQGALHQHADAELLLIEVNSVRRRFYDYQIPIIIIRNLQEDDLVDVFTRLNTTGTVLSRAELEHANRSKSGTRKPK